MALTLAVTSLAWGALVFAAVYPWAYRPLVGACALAGLIALMASRTSLAGLAVPGAVFGCVMLAIGVQLVPFSAERLSAINPAAVDLLLQLDLPYATGTLRSHPLTINPPATVTSLWIVAGLGTFLLGFAALLGRTGARSLVVAIAVLGAVVSLSGIVHVPSDGKIYGFWTLAAHDPQPFGPFVNRNHFAGWMLMALPLSLGLLLSLVDRSKPGAGRSFRDRVLWLGSPDAAKMALIGFGCGLMALSLVLTLSRSGIAAMLLALSVSGLLFMRSEQARTRKALGVAFLVFVGLIPILWVGAGRVSGKFSAANWSDLNGRLGPWADAWSVIRQAPLTGTGLNTYGQAMLLHQRHDMAWHYNQAHNDYLQLMAEGGVLVALPVLAAIVLLAFMTWRRLREDRGTSYRWLRIGAVTALVAIALQEIVDFSLQMPGNAAMFAMVCAIAVHQRPRDSRA